MDGHFSTTRRGLLRIVQSILLSKFVRFSALQAFSDVTRIANGPAGPRAVHTRRYRAQASVSLFSIPVLWRDDVGAACVSVEEAVCAGRRTTAIQFCGGSWPQRVRGINRFGITQELIHEEAGAVVESNYMCFMTSSPEKNSDQAWHAFADRSRAMILAVARGVSTRTSYRAAFEHVPAPDGSTWMDCAQLIDLLRSKAVTFLDSAPSRNDTEACPTFLYAVRRAMANTPSQTQYQFMHNAKLYDLRTSQSASNGVTVLAGHITEHGSRSESSFRLWFDPVDATGLPLKIEFQPRSFIRLTFEHDPAAAGPTLPNLIPTVNS
jgi:hypothetical protein